LNRLTEQRSGLFAEIAKYWKTRSSRTEEDYRFLYASLSLKPFKEELSAYDEDTMAETRRRSGRTAFATLDR
jgi:hypothetical protein